MNMDDKIFTMPVEDTPVERREVPAREKRPGPTGRVTDPWKRVTDKVAIVAFSKTTRHFAPFDDPTWEIWGLNEEYRFQWMRRWDRWFQIHPYLDFMRQGNPNDPKHPEWLRAQKPLGEPKAFPIYMQDQFADVPASIKFPLDEIERDLGINYYCSSISYMLGLAAWMGYKEVGMYGVEMASDTEYKYQRPNGEFWIGFMMGRGVKIHLPKEANLLRGQRYGFDWLPNVGRQAIEFDLVRMKNEEGQAMAKLNSVQGVRNYFAGQIQAAKTPDEKARWETELENAMKQIEQSFGRLNAVTGARQYINGLLNRIDRQIAPTFGADVRLSEQEGPVLYDPNGHKIEDPKKEEKEKNLKLIEEYIDYYDGEEVPDEQPTQAPSGSPAAG